MMSGPKSYPYCPMFFDFPGFTITPVFLIDPLYRKPNQDYLNMISMILLGLINILFGLWTIWPNMLNDCFFAPKNVSSKRSPLRKTIAVYQILTGLFFIELVMQLNLVTLIMAALHNLVEWVMIGVVVLEYYSESERKYWNTVSTFWIFTLINIIFCIPNILVAFTVEEDFGIWCDFLLVFFSLYIYFAEPNREKAARVWRYFLMAAIIHLAQIFFLLALGIRVIEPWPLGQLLINFSAIFNYYFYTRLAHEYDSSSKSNSDANSEGVQIEMKESGPETSKEEDSNIKSKEVGYDNNKVSHRPGFKISVTTFAMIVAAGIVASNLSVLIPVMLSIGCPEAKTERPSVFTHLTRIALTKIDKQDTLDGYQKIMIDSMKAAYKDDMNIMSKSFVGMDAFVIYEKWQYQDAFRKHVEKNPELMTLYRNPRTSQTRWRSIEVKNDGDTINFPNKEISNQLLNISEISNISDTHFCPDMNYVSGMTSIELRNHVGASFETFFVKLKEVTISQDRGNMFYWMHRQFHSDINFMVLEQWESQDALDFHLASQNVRAFAVQTSLYFGFGSAIGLPLREMVPCSNLKRYKEY